MNGLSPDYERGRYRFARIVKGFLHNSEAILQRHRLLIEAEALFSDTLHTNQNFILPSMTIQLC